MSFEPISDHDREYYVGGPNKQGEYLVGYAGALGFKTVLKVRDQYSASDLAQALQGYYDSGILV